MQPTYVTGVPAAATGGSGSGGPGAAPAAGGSVIYVPVMAAGPSPGTFYERYLHRQSIILGVGQVLIGILCIVFIAVGLVFSISAETVYVGFAFCGGVLFTITGSFGISAGKTKTRCQIVGFMVTCIFSTVCASLLLSTSIFETIMSNAPTTYDCSYQYNGYTTYTSCNQMVDMVSYKVAVAMQALLAISAFIEIVLAIWGSSICCQAVCCCNPQPQTTVMVPANYFANGGQMMYVNQAQGLPYAAYTQPPMENPYHQSQTPPPAYQTCFVHPTWNGSSSPPPSMPPISTVSPSAPVFEGLHPPSYLQSSAAAAAAANQSTETMKY